MATVDKAISDLIEAEEVTETDLLVLEQNAVAKKLTGGTLLNFLFTMLDGHGGILSIKKTGTSGLVDTYTITLADGDTTKFTVTNGEKGDKGDRSRVWFKYANVKPTDSYHNIYDVPGPWMGICSNYEDTAPDDWKAYTWAQIQGDPGKMGPVGPAPKFSIGSVASLEYGTEPWVQIHGSAANPILHFGIPRGKPGKDGTGAPDLSINDPEAPGYVAGRTHYWISDAAFILESSVSVGDTGVNDDVPAYPQGTLYAGDTAVVAWDEKTYCCPVRDVSDALGEYEQIAFGNMHLIDANFDDTGEPFAFRFDLEYTRVYSPTYAGHTVPFSLGRAEKVKKLDNVFLDLDWVPVKEETGTDGLVMKSRQIVFRESASASIASKAATGGGFDIKAGGLYTVTWNGTAYDCRCVEGEDGGLYLGNPALAGLTGENGEPFCIQAFRSGSDKIISSLIVYKETEDTQTVTLEILGHKEVTYDKIPEEFLPEGYGGGGGASGEDGGYYTPVVTQPDADTMQVAYTPSKTGMPTVAPKSIALPAGTDGKTAYQYAQEGGYTGTEEEFAKKLASESSGVHIGPDAPTDENVNLWIDTDDEPEDVGSSLDVTAEVGQTIVVKAVDENGKPTEWEAVDLPKAVPSDWNAAEGGPGHVLNRTHYSEVVELVPETSVEIGGDGMGIFAPAFDIIEGYQYMITINGVINNCATMRGDGYVGIADDSMSLMVFSGAEMMGDDTCMVIVASNYADTIVTMSIVCEHSVKIPEKFLPDSAKVHIITLSDGDIEEVGAGLFTSKTYDDFIHVLVGGGKVIIRKIVESETGMSVSDFLPIKWTFSSSIEPYALTMLVEDPSNELHSSNTMPQILFNGVTIPNFG